MDSLAVSSAAPALHQYYVYLTAGCNLACRHCWLAPTFHPNGGTGGHLDFELFRLALEEGMPLGLRSVKLTGGEPLLHPEFVRFVDLLVEKQLSIAIETNGTLLTPGLARRLKECGFVRSLSVSLDGAKPETHDAFRGISGSHQRAVAGLQALIAEGFRPQIIMSLHHGNLAEIAELSHLAVHWGAGSVKFNLVQSSGRGQKMSELLQAPAVPQLIEIGQWIENTLSRQVPIPLFFSWPMVFQKIKRVIENSDVVCSIRHILGILASGHVAMCGIGMETPDLCYGRLGKDHLQDIWRQHPMLLKLRADIPDRLEGICSECLFRQRCMGCCVAENYFATGRLTAPFWFCAQAASAGLFPAHRRC